MKRERQNEIMKMLVEARSITIEELVKHFQVSIETIRRDVNELSSIGAIRKIYGGIEIVSHNSLIPELESWNVRIKTCYDEKLCIANRALDLLPDNSTIALDTGTTTQSLAELLCTKKNLTLIISSIRMASLLTRNTHHRIYMIGGQLNCKEQNTFGTFSQDFIRHFGKIDFFVGGADGLSIDSGITEYYEELADIKRRLIEISNHTIILADHTKFGKKSLFKSCSVNSIDTLVTDTKTPTSYLTEFQDAGINIIIAK